jgi:serine/threonine protein kinase
MDQYKALYQKILNLSNKILDRKIENQQLLRQDENTVSLLIQFEMVLKRILRETNDRIFEEYMEQEQVRLINDLTIIDEYYQTAWDMYQAFRPRVAEDPALFPGRMLKDHDAVYVIRKKLGSGTRSHVFEATVYPGDELSPGIGRTVAIKEFPDLNLENNFHNELFILRHLDQLEDPGVITMTNGHRLIVMKFHHGYEMTQLIQQLREPLQSREALNDPTNGQHQFQMLLALRDEYAASLRKLHRKGVVHGDAWPSNVLICHGSDGCDGNKYQWIDFELARISSNEADFNKDLALALIAFDYAAGLAPRQLMHYGRAVWNESAGMFEYVLPPLHPVSL